MGTLGVSGPACLHKQALRTRFASIFKQKINKINKANGYPAAQRSDYRFESC